MPSYYISIQGSYTSVEVCLFRDYTCLETINDANKKASSHLIPMINTLLQNNNLTLQDLDFIALDKGPGAFTSLRVTIATVNGLGFACHTPLMSVNGLEALWKQTYRDLSAQNNLNSQDVIMCLLNAYNNDVYYYIKTINQQNEACEGYMNFDKFLVMIQNDFPNKQILTVGNGASLHEETLINSLNNNLTIYPLQVASAQQIGLMAYDKWINNEEPSTTIEPHYIKTQMFAISR